MDAHLASAARSCIGVARYKRGSRLKEAPHTFDCSGFVKWLYAQRGIWLPRRSIQQSVFGVRVGIEQIIGGDLVFTSGAIDYYFDDPSKGVGHVGIAVEGGAVVHAANAKRGIIETPLQEFTDGCFRDARRIVPSTADVRTFALPAEREVETAEDILWIIRQNLGKNLPGSRELPTHPHIAES